MAYHVIIPAAGNGSRMESSIPKQYLSLNAKSLIMHAVQCFCASEAIASVNVILSDADTHWPQAIKQTALDSKVNVWRCGGEARADTVLNGLSAIENLVAEDDWILVHDAARPGLSQRLLNGLIDTVKDDAVGGLLALPLADTLKKSDVASVSSVAKVAETIPREHLWQAQTPQMFRYNTLKQALSSFDGTPTDEAQAVEALGLQPILVTGALRNLKVTYPQDLAVVGALMQLEDEA